MENSNSSVFEFQSQNLLSSYKLIYSPVTSSSVHQIVLHISITHVRYDQIIYIWLCNSLPKLKIILLEELKISWQFHCRFCNIFKFWSFNRMHNNSESSTNGTSVLENELWRKSKSTLHFQRCVSCNDSFFCRISERHIETLLSEIPVLPRLFAFACTILISRWSFFPVCKNVGSFATSRASAHRAA